MDKLIAIAKECGVRVNWKHVDQDGWRMVPVGVSSVTMTPDQLHAYTEKVCKQMVEALTGANQLFELMYGINQKAPDSVIKCKEALAAYTEIMGDKK